MYHFHRFLVFALCFGGVCAYLQVPLLQDPDHRHSNSQYDLDTLSGDKYTVLKHPEFPSYNVRIKKSHFCDGTVQSFTGYIDIEARHLFFYFFESRSDPVNDDVIFWTSGGPGGSSAIGLFTELGPCRIVGPNETAFNPYSWNNNANVLFVDQPVGTGFSYADLGELVDTSEAAAKDIATFVFIFFQHFSKFQGNPFHFAGESYAGREIPLFAATLYDQNTRLAKGGMTPINLSSIMLGNGITDIYTMVTSFYDMTCTPATVPPVLSIETCVRMKRVSCIDIFDAIDCKAAHSFCLFELAEPYDSNGKSPSFLVDLSERYILGRNPYYLTGPYCEDDLCGSEAIKNMTTYLNLPETRHLLGVDSAKGNFSAVNYTIPNAFHAKMDYYELTTLYIGALLERGIRVLVYVGNYDWICNWVGNERWTLNLEWTGQQQFVSQPLREWYIDDGLPAGMTRSARGFTFATIEGGGHTAPGDKPKEALALIQRWLARMEL